MSHDAEMGALTDTRSRPRRRAGALVVLMTVALFPAVAAATASVVPAPAPPASDLAAMGWVWPLEGFRLERPFAAPAHVYGPGHRGVDLRASTGTPVRAPAAGTVAFSGAVAGRGILTVDHGDALVTTLEPIESELRAGTAVRLGDAVGTVSLGGHSPAGVLHFGVRLDGEYINPLLLLGGVPRAVLLPCC